MGRITGSLGRPISGISQQPSSVRFPGQCTDSLNNMFDLVDGLKTRPGTRYLSKISNTGIDINTKIHYYSRGDNNESYFIALVGNEIKIYSPDGTEHIVNIVDQGAMDYILLAKEPRKDLIFKTISDYTFVINTKVGVKISPEKTPKRKKQAILNVQFMDYAQTQTVSFKITEGGGFTQYASYTSPDGSDKSHKALVATDYVSKQLYDKLVAANIPGYTFELVGNCIFVSCDDAHILDVRCTDDAGGDNLIVVNSSVSDTSKLPGKAPDGFIIEIDPPGSNTQDNSNYWLKAVSNGAGGVTWRETIGPDEFYKFDLNTMPVTITRDSIADNGVATFSIKYGKWEPRDVGDDRTNPFPSFATEEGLYTIRNLGIFQNRLFFISDENIVFSRTDFYFRFWKDSTKVSLDTDVIDIYADSKKLIGVINSNNLVSILIKYIKIYLLNDYKIR